MLYLVISGLYGLYAPATLIICGNILPLGYIPETPGPETGKGSGSSSFGSVALVPRDQNGGESNQRRAPRVNKAGKQPEGL